MRKFIAIAGLILAVASVEKVSAQTVQPSYLKPEFKTITRQNLVNTDTLNLEFTEVGSGVKTLTLNIVKVSGTIAGKVYLYGINDPLVLVPLDSITLSDKAGPQWKEYKPTATSYKTYRMSFLPTGTQVSTPYFTLTRRPDEK